MGVEIERKFVVESNAWRGAHRSSSRLYQGYLSNGAKCEVRVRTTESAAFLTIKSKGTLQRQEFEYEIPHSDAKAILELCTPYLIEKIRYELAIDDLTWHIDEYFGRHTGLIVAEIELKNPNQPVTLPSWIGREVTEDRNFKNANLAENPNGWRPPT